MPPSPRSRVTPHPHAPRTTSRSPPSTSMHLEIPRPDPTEPASRGADLDTLHADPRPDPDGERTDTRRRAPNTAPSHANIMSKA